MTCVGILGKLEAEWEVSRQRRIALAVRLTHCPHERNFELAELPNCLCEQNNQGILQSPFQSERELLLNKHHGVYDRMAHGYHI